MNREKGFALVLSGLCVVSLLSGFAHVKLAEGEKKQQELIIPTINEVRENGYPVNERGESYGVDDRESIETSPNLILAENEDGLVGYIKASDMDRLSPTNPEEARYYQSEGYYVDMYLQDGQTKVGTFFIAKGSTQ